MNTENSDADFGRLNVGHDGKPFELFFEVVRERKLVLTTAIVVTAAALGISLMMKPVFTSTTVILPPQQQNNSFAAALGSLGALAGVGGVGMKGSSDIYVGILKSRTVADSLIKRFALKSKYEVDDITTARIKLEAATSINAGKDGLITVSVDDFDPVMATKLANGYVAELRSMNQSLAVTDASRRRVFYEKQLKQIREDLSIAETSLKKTQESTGLLQPEGQVRAMIEAIAMLKAQIATRQVQLASMSSFTTSSHPEVLRLKQEQIELQRQLTQMEQGSQSNGDITLPTKKVPEMGLSYLRAIREVKYQETLFELVSKQYEIARYEEAKDSSLVQVLDVAVIPEAKTKPRKALIVIAGAMLGLLWGVVFSIIRIQLRKDGSHIRRFLFKLKLAFKK